MSSDRGGYYVEYAKSGRSSCKSCKGGISEGSVRVGWETKSTMHDGWDMGWYHTKCCNKGDDDAPNFAALRELKGWEYLRWDDQLQLKKKLKDKGAEDPATEERRKAEITKLWDMKDELAEGVNAKLIKELVDANGMRTEKVSPHILLHVAADGLLWGKTGPCPECKGPEVHYNTLEYKCKGWLTTFTRCSWTGPSVQRYRWKIPEALRARNKWLKDFAYPKDHPTDPQPAFAAPGSSDPAAPAAAAAAAAPDAAGAEKKEEDVEMEPAGPEEEPPAGQELYGIVVGFAGSAKELGSSRDALAETVEAHGGTVSDEGATVFVAGASELSRARKTKKVQKALDDGAPFVSAQWLADLCERSAEGGVALLRKPEGVKRYLLEGSPEPKDSVVARKYFKERAEKEASKAAAAAGDEDEGRAAGNKRRNPVKKPAPKPGTDVLRVDPAFGKSAEVLVTYDEQYGHTPYHAMLNVTDISTGVNKFYRMQVLKTSAQRYAFFIHWGRTGTEIGDKRAYPNLSESSAIDRFCEKFAECTGVDWSERQWFEKRPGKYNMTELDDGNDAAADLAEVESRRQAKRQKRAEAGGQEPEKAAEAAAGAAAALDPRVREFVSSIFDKDMMKNQLKAMAVDVKKMPLGKISKKQIQSAYAVLNSASEALQVQPVSQARIRDCTNKFYTLVPHDFGEKDPQLIDNVEIIKQKLELLDVLCEIEVANALIEGAGEEGDKIYKNYQSLKTNITPLDKEGELYKMLENYAYDSHDTSYFRGWTFKIDDIFAVEREGETARFEAWKENPNRQLLWHGSRLTNYVGILSNGLRIAPPEAPKTGYRFGKGIYFANCVSKSASYCFTTRDNPHGVMILNEVAVGVPFETPKDIYMEKPQPGSDSTWAQGMTVPDPAKTATIENGIKVPRGKPVPSSKKTMCSHDEIIVYNAAQVRIRFLLRVTFTHK
eukprot:m51a1_g2255 putative polyADP-ribosyltransferase (945) ;mRNA; r:312365-315852